MMFIGKVTTLNRHINKQLTMIHPVYLAWRSCIKNI